MYQFGASRIIFHNAYKHKWKSSLILVLLHDMNNITGIKNTLFWWWIGARIMQWSLQWFRHITNNISLGRGECDFSCSRCWSGVTLIWWYCVIITNQHGMACFCLQTKHLLMIWFDDPSKTCTYVFFIKEHDGNVRNRCWRLGFGTLSSKLSLLESCCYRYFVVVGSGVPSCVCVRLLLRLVVGGVLLFSSAATSP